MSFKKMAFTALVVAAVPFTAVAQDSESQTPPNIFADCGIGGAIFKNDALGMISNLIWDASITAMISGVSSPETCSGVEVAVAEFINDTYVSISEETAKGQGEHLTAMLDIAGCSTDAQSGIIASLRDGYVETLAADGYIAQSTTEKAESYFDLLRANTAASCDLS